MTTTQIIAEAGVNHDGQLDRAFALVDVAAEAGADWVKFQTFDPAALVAEDAVQAEYQTANTGRRESQRSMLDRLVLSQDAHVALRRHCENASIRFLSTPFDPGSLNFLLDVLGLDTLKFGSGDLTNAPLLLRAARSPARLIISTGMATDTEIEAALGTIAFGVSGSRERPGRTAFREAFADPSSRERLRDKVTLLHCTSAYPAPFDSLNLKAIPAMADRYSLPVGFSDHSAGIAAPLAAVALGAVMIEKHVTLDRTLPGPDHAASLEPSELTAMVAGIRQIELAMGDARKVLRDAESNVRDVARKSLHTARAIKAGDLFTEENLTTLRPGTGVCASEYHDWLGRRAARDYRVGERIDAI